MNTRIKVFCFFFSKKKTFFLLKHRKAATAAWWASAACVACRAVHVLPIICCHTLADRRTAMADVAKTSLSFLPTGPVLDRRGVLGLAAAAAVGFVSAGAKAESQRPSRPITVRRKPAAQQSQTQTR